MSTLSALKDKLPELALFPRRQSAAPPPNASLQGPSQAHARLCISRTPTLPRLAVSLNNSFAAARRGVDVRILTGGPTTDINAARLAGRAYYDTLLTGGVRINEWKPTVLSRKDLRHRSGVGHDRLDELR
jgi:hypothetical protein